MLVENHRVTTSQGVIAMTKKEWKTKQGQKFNTAKNKVSEAQIEAKKILGDKKLKELTTTERAKYDAQVVARNAQAIKCRAAIKRGDLDTKESGWSGIDKNGKATAALFSCLSIDDSKHVAE